MYDLTRKGRPFNWGKEQQDYQPFEGNPKQINKTTSAAYAK